MDAEESGVFISLGFGSANLERTAKQIHKSSFSLMTECDLGAAAS